MSKYIIGDILENFIPDYGVPKHLEFDGTLVHTKLIPGSISKPKSWDIPPLLCYYAAYQELSQVTNKES